MLNTRLQGGLFLWSLVVSWSSHATEAQALLRGGRQLVNADMVEFINPKHCGFYAMHGWTESCMDVDWCNHIDIMTDKGSSCGQEAADVFCANQTLGHAYTWTKRSKIGVSTFVQGDRWENRNPNTQDGFASIVCMKKTPITLTTTDVRYRGFPVDFCLVLVKGRGEDCGQPAADAFCRTWAANLRASAFTKAKVNNTTWLQGRGSDASYGERNDVGNQDGFSSVTCTS